MQVSHFIMERGDIKLYFSIPIFYDIEANPIFDRSHNDCQHCVSLSTILLICLPRSSCHLLLLGGHTPKDFLKVFGREKPIN